METKASKNGRAGENAAALFLEGKGFDIVLRNYHSRYGEIDIIAKNDSYIVFAEVKARSYGAVAKPREWVDSRKQERIVKTAALFLQSFEEELQPRFDVLEVILNKEGECVKILHIENAFDSMI